MMAMGLTAVSCADAPYAAPSPAPSSAAAPAEPLKVAAASDLARAFEEVGAVYEKETGSRVVFTFGSTGMFARQLHEGAPFDVFAAANVKFVDEVVRGGRCRAETKALYARGRIVLLAKPGSPVVATVEDLVDPRYRKIAIANPEHAPYGAAAKQALERAGVYERVKDRLVFGENILQTRQFVTSGNADVGIVALSLAIGAEYAEIPAERHDPLDQALVVCAEGARLPAARAFVEWVGGEKGRSIMRRYGFVRR
jgi:molybdate transport system substrate-binding protein